ncbi:MAG: MBL fold metallo-hydrolase [Candidatus Thermoplasmatota archaeon]|nr:MBL fold metallo-hydrolase [Candidatus Thermoplasmatota archaeon]
MLFERIKSEGIAHYSYIIGDQNEAVVIDPRRDVRKYIDLASQHGMNIKMVLETHRNEDYIIGSYEIKKRTDADIYHADEDLDYAYGKAAEEDDTWNIGRLKVKAIHTPGHTLGSMSYVLYDPDEEPWMVFTGDALFAGDVGRVDFYGEENLEETAFKLYDSIFNKLLPLGDEVIVCPAHGSGSVCASEIAERELTTIGIEKDRNPKLQVENKEEFAEKTAEMLEYPPYFKKMEEMNLDLPEHTLSGKTLEYLSPPEFKKRAEDAVILDTRKELSFGASHIPGALSIWEDGVPSFAGWFLPYDKPILLVDESGNPEKALTYLKRIGYDNVEGCLAGGMLSWHMSGEESDSIDTVNVHEVCDILDEDRPSYLLDVRPEKEIEQKGNIQGAHELHVTKLLDNMDEVPKDKPIYIFCGSGLRSMTAASLLKKNGWEDLHVVLGGLSGWSSTTCPVE